MKCDEEKAEERRKMQKEAQKRLEEKKALEKEKRSQGDRGGEAECDAQEGGIETMSALTLRTSIRRPIDTP